MYTKNFLKVVFQVIIIDQGTQTVHLYEIQVTDILKIGLIENNAYVLFVISLILRTSTILYSCVLFIVF